MGGLLRVISGLVVVGVVVVGGLFVLSVMGAPKPSCADGPVAFSRAAADSFNTKWNTFASALNRGGVQTVTFTEEEVSSRAVSYAAENGLNFKDLQVHLCPGPGKGEALFKVDAAGNSVEVLVTGHLDTTTSPGRIAVDSVQVGRVPEQVATALASAIVAQLRIQVPSEIKEASSTTTSVTLRGQR